MSDQEYGDFERAHIAHLQAIEARIDSTNRMLAKIQRRSIFWPVCFAIIFAPIVAMIMVLALLMIPSIATAISQLSTPSLPRIEGPGNREPRDDALDQAPAAAEPAPADPLEWAPHLTK